MKKHSGEFQLLGLPQQISSHSMSDQWLDSRKLIPTLVFGQNADMKNAESDVVIVFCSKRKQVLTGRLVVSDGRLTWVLYSLGGYLIGLSENGTEVSHWHPIPLSPPANDDS